MLSLQEREVGPPDPEYSFPECVLSYIRDIVPENIKGEIREVFYFSSLPLYLGYVEGKICLGSRTLTHVFFFFCSSSQDAYKVTLKEFCLAIDIPKASWSDEETE